MTSYLYVETSAIVAILCDEPRAGDLVAAMQQAEAAFVTSCLTRLEVTLALSRIFSLTHDIAEEFFNRFVAETELTLLPLDDKDMSKAVQASFIFGKGRHPASLNLADCIAYAIAKDKNMPMLFIGHDFSKTDIISVLTDTSP